MESSLKYQANKASNLLNDLQVKANIVTETDNANLKFFAEIKGNLNQLQEDMKHKISIPEKSSQFDHYHVLQSQLQDLEELDKEYLKQTRELQEDINSINSRDHQSLGEMSKNFESIREKRKTLRDLNSKKYEEFRQNFDQMKERFKSSSCYRSLK